MLNRIRSSNFSRHSRRAVILGLAALFGLFGTIAHAADALDGPRSAGTVGERYDGYAVARDGASASDKQLVASINDKRRAFYQQKANEQGVDILSIQGIYAKAIYDKAPSGWWFLTQSGWSRK